MVQFAYAKMCLMENSELHGPAQRNVDGRYSLVINATAANSRPACPHHGGHLKITRINYTNPISPIPGRMRFELSLAACYPEYLDIEFKYYRKEYSLALDRLHAT